MLLLFRATGTGIRDLDEPGLISCLGLAFSLRTPEFTDRDKFWSDFSAAELGLFGT